MALTRLSDNYGKDGVDVVFQMTDGKKPVVCRVSRWTLADYEESSNRSVEDMFLAHRDIVERAASDLHDAGDIDDQGQVLVTLAAVNRASRNS